MACHLLSDVYDKLTTDKKNARGGSSAQSYLHSGVGSRALYALAAHCVYNCGVGEDSVLEHLSMQFDGSDILTTPFPSGRAAMAGPEISERAWYTGDLFWGLRAFPSTMQYAWKQQSVDTPRLRRHRFYVRKVAVYY